MVDVTLLAAEKYWLERLRVCIDSRSTAVERRKDKGLAIDVVVAVVLLKREELKRAEGYLWQLTCGAYEEELDDEESLTSLQRVTAN